MKQAQELAGTTLLCEDIEHELIDLIIVLNNRLKPKSEFPQINSLIIDFHLFTKMFPAGHLLALIALLDSLGARAISLRLVSFITAVVLLGIRRTIGLWGGVEWHALLHAILVGFGALGCRILEGHFERGGDMGGTITLDYRGSAMTEEDARGLSEARRIALCLGPLTSLHRLIPALTLGYSICDVLDSFKLGPAFLMHGLATAVVMGFFCELGNSHVVTPMLLMELSTILLTTVRARFYSPGVQAGVQLSFVLSFFVVRLLWVPQIWWDITVEMNRQRGSDVDTCFLNTVFCVVILFGLFFHSLNAYWFYRMILKIQRKLAGKEKKDNVDME